VALSVGVSMVTRPKPAEELVGLVYSETPRDMRIDPKEASYPWFRRTVPLASVALVMVIVLNVII
jgi:SSS family solute:Na+ symporter